MSGSPIIVYERNKISPGFRAQRTKSETPQGLSVHTDAYQGCKFGYMLHLFRDLSGSPVYKSAM